MRILPPNTVIGRLGSSLSGPDQAISFSQLLTALGGITNVVGGPPTSTVGNLATWSNATGSQITDSGVSIAVLSDLVNAGDPKWGIIGDGVADDGPAINAMSAAAVSMGATKIIFPPGKTFRTTTTYLKARQNLIWDGQGSTFVTGVGFPTIPLGIFGNNADSTKTLIGTVTGTSVTGPTDQLTLTSTAGLSIGNWIAVRLGVDPYDNAEPFYPFVAQVTNIVGSTITFDWVIPTNVNFNAYTYVQKDPNSAAGGNISVPATPAGNKSVYLLTTDFALNLTFQNMVLQGDQNGNIEGGFGFLWGANIRFENIIGNPLDTGDMGAGLFVMQFCRNIRINNAYLGYNNNTSGQGSKGRMYTFSSCVDVVDKNHFSKDCKNQIAFSEDYCDKVMFISPVDVINKDTVSASTPLGYSFNTRANGELINPIVYNSVPTSNTNFVYIGSAGSDGDYRITGTFKWRGPLAAIVTVAANKLDCIFDYDDPTIGFARIDFGNKSTYKYRIPLFPSMSVIYQIPGQFTELDIIASNGVTVSSVTGLQFFFLVQFVDLHASLVAGTVVNIGGSLPHLGFTVLGASFGGVAGWTNQPTSFEVFTSAAAQTDGNFVGVVARVPRVLEANIGVFASGQSYTLTDDQLCAVLNGTPQRIVESGLLVASLPAAAASNKGERRIVTDATVTTFASVVAGGSGNTVPVYSDGSNWRIG